MSLPIDPDSYTFKRPIAKIIGIGGAGCNVIHNAPLESIAICTMNDHLRPIACRKCIKISKNDLEILKSSDLRVVPGLHYELKSAISDMLGESNIIYICAGLGGETGTIVAPVVSSLCKKFSDLIIMALAFPFSVEGKDRHQLAMKGLVSASQTADLIIIYENDRLLRVVPYMSLHDALEYINEAMMMPLLDLVASTTVRDLCDIRNMFSSSKYAVMCSGKISPVKMLDDLYLILKNPWGKYLYDSVDVALLIISAKIFDNLAVNTILEETKRIFSRAEVKFYYHDDKNLDDALRVTVLLGSSKYPP